VYWALEFEFQILRSRDVGMWAKARAVGNAQRCPRTVPVRAKRIVHMSTDPSRSLLCELLSLCVPGRA